MNPKNKIHKGWLALFFVIFHFVCIIIYAFPPNIIPEKVQGMAAHYVSPVFDQKWNMFAPAPVIQSTIEVKYYFKNGDSSIWIRPALNALKRHMETRFTFYGELALAESNMAYWVQVDIDYLDLIDTETMNPEQWSDFRKGYSYRKLQNYVKGYSRINGITGVQAYVVRYDYLNVKTGKKGVLYLPKINL
ncbi:DUF5819 family protein [Crocinitomix catalasitica]|uniref:DUF5819 family protein n=1 Tax=Crocinitomix catalasitica TaxID=184607 RepID=UPI0004891F90|nr:DUF5819 family protein [Crocinitomix catalasitica]